MAHIHFGARNEANEFQSYDIVKAGLDLSTPDTLTEQLESKIDDLFERITKRDHVRGELLRACPYIQIVDKDGAVVTDDENPAYEHMSINISALGERTDVAGQYRQEKKNEDKRGNTNATVSTGKRSKKDQAREIYHANNNLARKDILDQMMTQLSISKAHASTYYQAIKNEASK